MGPVIFDELSLLNLAFTSAYKYNCCFGNSEFLPLQVTMTFVFHKWSLGDYFKMQHHKKVYKCRRY